MQQRNKILVFVILFILVSIVFVVFIFTVSTQKSNLTINIAPQEVTMTYDNTTKQVSNGNVLSMKEGTYNITFSKQNFKDQTKIVTIPKDTNLSVVLDPINNVGIQELYNAENQQALQGVGDLNFIKQEEFAKNNPITTKLPYKNFLFSITYEENTNSDQPYAITLIIDAPYGYREGAINLIRSWGFNPAEYNIVFRRYVNPFAL